MIEFRDVVFSDEAWAALVAVGLFDNPRFPTEVAAGIQRIGYEVDALLAKGDRMMGRYHGGKPHVVLSLLMAQPEVVEAVRRALPAVEKTVMAAVRNDIRSEADRYMAVLAPTDSEDTDG